MGCPGMQLCFTVDVEFYRENFGEVLILSLHVAKLLCFVVL